MSNGSRLASSLRACASRQFETKDSRFKLAVTSGFLLVATGALVLGVNAHSGVADSIWGAMSVGGSASVSGATGDSGGRNSAYRSAGLSDDQRPIYERKRNRSRDGAKFQLTSAEDGDGAAVALGRRSMCVRLCDGFAFPVGTYRGDGDLAAHESTCRSECPGAETAVYVVPKGSDSMSDATQARSGKSYSELPAAFHYTTVLSDACTCHPAAGNKIKSLLHDFTLRRGDAVMTTAGIRVFHGAARYPYKRTDFATLSKSRDVPKQQAGAIRAIEQASLKVVPSVTAAANAAPPRTAARGTKALQHQASLEAAR